jgi:hypothetical protein
MLIKPEEQKPCSGCGGKFCPGHGPVGDSCELGNTLSGSKTSVEFLSKYKLLTDLFTQRRFHYRGCYIASKGRTIEEVEYFVE